MKKGELTRLNILTAAFKLIYLNGYQATSIDEILKKTNVTKGAFFHHFKNKDEMGLAMIKEIIYPGMHQKMIAPLAIAKDPINELYKSIQALLDDKVYFDIQHGCPAVNLIDEMGPINATFKQALSKLTENWQMAIQNHLRVAKSMGKIKAGINEEMVAVFIVSGYSGIRNIGKVYGQSAYGAYLNELKFYLKSL